MEIAVTSTVLGSVIALFVCFLDRRRIRAVAGRVQRPTPAGVLLPGVAIEFGYWLLTPFIGVFRRLRITPNTLSFLSLPFAMLAALSIGCGHFGLGGPLLLVAFGLDAWDGLLARETAAANDAGEVVDATLDRYNDVVVMLGFLYYYRLDVVPWLLASATLVGTVVVSYARAKGQAFGIDPNFGCFQRHERAVCLGVAATLAPALAILASEPADHPQYYAVVLALAALAVGTNVTAVSRSSFVINRLRAAGQQRPRIETAPERGGSP
jgi:CDP-diacylglycerol--glycerol-3-phosphate 3-phosphatidyltransferase